MTLNQMKTTLAILMTLGVASLFGFIIGSIVMVATDDWTLFPLNMICAISMLVCTFAWCHVEETYGQSSKKS